MPFDGECVITRRQSKSLRASLSAGFLLVLYGCATSNVFQGADFQTRIQAIKRVVVTVPDVRIVRRVIGGAEQQLTDDDVRAAEQLTKLVSAAFGEHGFQVKIASLNSANRVRTLNAYDLIAQDYTFDEVSGFITEHNNRPTLTSDISLLATQDEANGVVFTRFLGLTRSHGSVAAQTAVNILVGLATAGTVLAADTDPKGTAMLEIVLADGKTGDVLWANGDTDRWGFNIPAFDEEDLSGLVTKVFAKFPQ